MLQFDFPLNDHSVVNTLNVAMGQAMGNRLNRLLYITGEEFYFTCKL